MEKKTRHCDAQAVTLSDINATIVSLDAGTYLIDGSVIKVSGYSKTTMEVKDVDNIRKVSIARIPSHYVNHAGVEMSIEDYDAEVFRLESFQVKEKRKCVDADDDYTYYDVLWPEGTEVQQVQHIKLKRFTLIHKDNQVIGDPINVDVGNIMYDTGNEYIKALYLIKGDISSLYTYNRKDARIAIAHEVFESLGMEYVEGMDNNGTKDKHIYSSMDGKLRYAKAFGSYVFHDGIDMPNTRGTFADIQKLYDDDKKYFLDLLTKKYNKHFGATDLDSEAVSDIIYTLTTIKDSVMRMDVKIRCEESPMKAVTALRGVIDKLERSFKRPMTKL